MVLRQKKAVIFICSVVLQKPWQQISKKKGVLFQLLVTSYTSKKKKEKIIHLYILQIYAFKDTGVEERKGSQTRRFLAPRLDPCCG